MRKLISLVIVNFNSAEYLTRLMAKVMNYSQVDWEAVIVDNGSADGSGKVLGICQRDKRVKVIKNEKNLGFAKASNAGARAAKGDYLLFVNPDVELEEGGLLKLINFMEQSPQIAAASPELASYWPFRHSTTC